MTAGLTLIVVVLIALLISRVATVALTMTGMSLDEARFQARSALTGTGFTTSAAEAVVSNPARRRIIMLLMLVSGAGAVSVLGTLMLSFTNVSSADAGWRRAALIAGGLVILVWLSHSKPIDAVLRRVIEVALRRYAGAPPTDFANLLHVREDWAVARVSVPEGGWLTSGPVGDLDLPDAGVVILGIERHDGGWEGLPSDSVVLETGDAVVLYGRLPILEKVTAQPAGQPEPAPTSARSPAGASEDVQS